MKTIIIEDEQPAREKLIRYLGTYDANIEVIFTTDNLEEAGLWLSQHQQNIDLIFLDIQLTDGVAFQLFDRLMIHTPIIFTTAYDEYAIDAFKVLSIGYLLKPYTYTDLSQTLDKWEEIKQKWSLQNVNKIFQDTVSPYKRRFMVKKGSRIQSLEDNEIALFLADGRTLFLWDQTGQRFLIDYTLQELELKLDPKMYFRINRSIMVNISVINEVSVFSSSRLKIKLTIPFQEDLIVSRDRVSHFKEWLDGQ